MGPDIWQRAVQVVTNDAALRPFAAERSLAELEEGGVLSDYFVRLAGYLLGEYARVTALEAERVRRVRERGMRGGVRVEMGMGCDSATDCCSKEG